MNEVYWLLPILAAFVIGGNCGMWLEARRWRNNANTYIRIESNGRFYKVFSE